MKLNHECVRDILILVEECCNYSTSWDVSTDELPQYDHSTLLYTADKLLENGFINGKSYDYAGCELPDIQIRSLTWEGHQFLDNIRDESVWKDTKNVLSKFSSVSLGIVNTVASQVISALVRSQLGL